MRIPLVERRWRRAEMRFMRWELGLMRWARGCRWIGNGRWTTTERRKRKRRRIMMRPVCWSCWHILIARQGRRRRRMGVAGIGTGPEREGFRISLILWGILSFVEGEEGGICNGKRVVFERVWFWSLHRVAWHGKVFWYWYGMFLSKQGDGITLCFVETGKGQGVSVGGRFLEGHASSWNCCASMHEDLGIGKTSGGNLEWSHGCRTCVERASHHRCLGHWKWGV